MTEAAHGRTPAVATGIKRARPGQVRVHLPGRRRPGRHRHGRDVHAANRGENITIIFINNAVYGMTGGQMAPTTLVNMKTSTSPPAATRRRKAARSASANCSPARRPGFLARMTINLPARPRDEAAIERAFDTQLKKGFSLVEISRPLHDLLADAADKAMEAIESWMVKTFPLGVYKDKEAANAKTAQS